MPFALVRNSASDYLVVDVVLLSKEEFGATIKVWSGDRTSQYDAFLLDVGSKQEIEAKRLLCLALEDEGKRDEIDAAVKSSKSTRRSRATTPNFIATPSAPAKRKAELSTPGRTKKAAKKTLSSQVQDGDEPSTSAPVDSPSSSNTDIQDLDSMDAMSLLRMIMREIIEVRKSQAEHGKLLKDHGDKLVACATFMAKMCNEEERDIADMGRVVESVTTQSKAMIAVKSSIEDIAQNMPRKLGIVYSYLPESTVIECDRDRESATVFASRMEPFLFTESETMLYVEERDPKKYNWMIEVIYRRRTSSCESMGGQNHLASIVKTRLDQKVRRRYIRQGLEPPASMRERKKMENEEEKRARIEETAKLRQEVEDSRRAMARSRGAAAAKKKGYSAGIGCREGKPSARNSQSQPIPSQSPHHEYFTSEDESEIPSTSHIVNARVNGDERCPMRRELPHFDSNVLDIEEERVEEVVEEDDLEPGVYFDEHGKQFVVHDRRQ